MLDLPRGQREAGASVVPTAGVAAGSTAKRQSGGREGLDADRFFTYDVPRLSRVQVLPEAYRDRRASDAKVLLSQSKAPGRRAFKSQGRKFTSTATDAGQRARGEPDDRAAGALASQ